MESQFELVSAHEAEQSGLNTEGMAPAKREAWEKVVKSAERLDQMSMQLDDTIFLMGL